MRKHDASRTSGSSARMVEVRVRGRNFASARLAVRRSFLALRFHEDPTRVADELTLGLGQSEIFGCTPIKQVRAGGGNRTRTSTLEGSHASTTPHPHA